MGENIQHIVWNNHLRKYVCSRVGEPPYAIIIMKNKKKIIIQTSQIFSILILLLRGSFVCLHNLLFSPGREFLSYKSNAYEYQLKVNSMLISKYQCFRYSLLCFPPNCLLKVISFKDRRMDEWSIHVDLFLKKIKSMTQSETEATAERQTEKKENKIEFRHKIRWTIEKFNRPIDIRIFPLPHAKEKKNTSSECL